nr:fibronectin type III domain-containing protein [Halorubrum sp. C191]
MANEDGYRVYRDTSAGVNRTQANEVADLSANTESYTDTGLTDSTEYHYVIEAYTVDDTATTAEASATTIPAAPSGTGLDTSTRGEVTVSWTDNSQNEDGYRMYRSQSDSGYTQVADLGANTTSYTDTGLEDGEEYWYYVEAYVGSKTASGASVSAVTPLPSASSLAAVESAQDEATASWSNEDNSSDGSIAVERSTDGFSSVTTVASGLSPSTTSYVDTTVEGTETYAYRIERSTDHATATSGTASVTINGPPWFTADAEQPANGATGVSRSPTLAVEVNDPDGNPVDVTFYDASDDTQIGQTQTDVPSGSSTSVEWSGLGFATVCEWYAVADDGLETTTSPTFSFTTADGVPQNVAVSATAENELTVEWDPVDVAAGYYVYRAESSGSTASDYTQVADVASPPFVDTDVVDGERYYYRVSSHD